MASPCSLSGNGAAGITAPLSAVTTPGVEPGGTQQPHRLRKAFNTISADQATLLPESPRGKRPYLAPRPKPRTVKPPAPGQGPGQQFPSPVSLLRGPRPTNAGGAPTSQPTPRGAVAVSGGREGPPSMQTPTLSSRGFQPRTCQRHTPPRSPAHLPTHLSLRLSITPSAVATPTRAAASSPCRPGLQAPLADPLVASVTVTARPRDLPCPPPSPVGGINALKLPYG